MEQHKTAIIAAISVNKLKPLDFPLIDAANGFLKNFGLNAMSENEFELAMIAVKQTIATFKDGMNLKQKIPSMNDAQSAKFLGDKSVFLVHGPVQKYTNNIVEIEFNCDSKGGIRLPNGEIVKDSLVSLTRRYNREFEITDKTEAGETTKYAWRVSKEKHPEITRNMTIKQYIKTLWEG
jgi:hypothetical protein